MSGFLLDTNIISELIRPEADSGVVAWVGQQAPEHLFLCSMTIGELMRGAQKLGDTHRGEKLRRWVRHDIVAQFKSRILAFDEQAALQWGSMMGEHDSTGTTLPAADAQIAAIAIVNGLTIVTRNTKDFVRMVDGVINPFEAAH